MRTVGGRYLLRPSPRFTALTTGVLARAQEHTDTQVHAYSFLSNHAHMLLSVEHAEELARFMCYVNGNLARIVCREHNWSGRVWARRYTSILLAEDQELLAQRLRYILAQGTKEGLVASPLHWRGASSVHALAAGKLEQRGVWVDRTALWRANRSNPRWREADFERPHLLYLTPLPGLGSDYFELVTQQVREIETEARLSRGDTPPLGMSAVQSVDVLDGPVQEPSAPAPIAMGPESSCARIRAAYREVVARFVAASRRLRESNGSLDEFPEGTFPPSGRFRFPAGET